LRRFGGGGTDDIIIETINQLLLPEPVEPKRRIGFHAGE
jgi:hypothetical protein